MGKLSKQRGAARCRARGERLLRGDGPRGRPRAVGRGLAGARTSRRRATASGPGSRGGGRRVCPGALRRLDAWLDGRWLQDATLAAYLAALTSLRRIPDEEEPRE